MKIYKMKSFFNRKKSIKYDKIGDVPDQHESFQINKITKKSKLKQWLQNIKQMNQVKYT